MWQLQCLKLWTHNNARVNSAARQSSLTSQYFVLCTPDEYAWANLLSELSAVTALLNWDMGCKVVGKLFSSVTTCDGRAARFAHSFETACTYKKYSTLDKFCECFLCVLSNTSKAENTSHTAIGHQLLKVYTKFLNLPLGLRMASGTAI